MAKDPQRTIPVRPAYQVRRGAVKAESGLAVKYVACAIFDTAKKDSSGAANTTIAVHGTGVYLPAGAIITKAWIDVKTTMADGASDAATLAVTTEGTGDLVAAIAISDASNVWDAGLHGTLCGTQALDGNSLTAIANAAAAAAAMIKTTQEREIKVAVAVHALATGKMAIFVEYYIGL